MRYALLSTLLVASACAATPPPLAAPPPSPAPAAEKPGEAPPPPPSILALEVPPPPPECAPFSTAVSEAAPACEPVKDILSALSRALEVAETDQRDRSLACIEKAAPEHAGLIRALRAELAPVACADVLVTPFIETPPAGSSADDESTWMGLFLAARLNRLVSAPPTLKPPFDKARFMEFFESTLRPWMIAQAKAVGQLSLEASRLRGYGKAVAAVEAAMSDLRFVQAVRAVPLPTELDTDADVRNVYYAALDEALEPRKARGRDAALVGLRVFAELGVIGDARVQRARSLLSELYAGSRVDALDRLLLPELVPVAGGTPAQRLARKLPTYYAGRLRPAFPALGDPALLRDYLEQGVSPEVRTALAGARLDANARLLYARFEFRRGQIYFAGPAFAKAAEVLGQARSSEAAELVFALATALTSAPKDVAELMLSTRRVGPLPGLTALDAIAKGRGRFNGEATFDAAYLRSLTPPEGDARFWTTIAADFKRAALLLEAPAAQKLATEYADAAEKTARAVGPAKN